MLSRVRKVTRRADDGASALEYGLLAAAIIALVVIVVLALSGLVRDVFSDDCKSDKVASASAGDC